MAQPPRARHEGELDSFRGPGGSLQAEGIILGTTQRFKSAPSFNQRVDNRGLPDIFNSMVEQQSRLDLVFQALSDPTRRAMLERLSRGEQTVTELASPYRMSLAAASKHIQNLERAGLVRRTIRGRIHYCRIDPRPLERADEWLRNYERLWDTRIERLKELLRHPDNEQD
jgi:DNA-binding transcriptional ArsR family regulator